MEDATVAKALVPTQSQLNIIQHPALANEILAIVAGPGSGKTYTVASRVAYLLKEGKLLPEEILVLTMTNRAVFSFKSNLANLVGEQQAEHVSISTFHSFCANLIDLYGQKDHKKRLLDDLSWRNFATFFLGKTVGLNGKKLDTKISAPVLEKLLDGIKSGSTSIDQASAKHNISKEYIEALILYLDKNGIVRYSHFITDALALIDSSNLLEQIPQLSKYKAIIVDEFQDMHFLLLSLIKRIVNFPSDHPGKHLTIAGDPHQCIYEFLGSDPTLLTRISNDFPDFHVTTLSIEETFRLTPEVLLAAREVALRPNGLIDERTPPVTSTKAPLFRPIINDFSSISDEVDFIGREITRLILELGGVLKPKDFIILGRTNKEVITAETILSSNYGFKCNRFALSTNWINLKVHLFLDIISVLTTAAGSDFSLLCCLVLLDRRVGAKTRVSKLFNAYSESSSADLETFVFQEINKPKSLAKIYKSVDQPTLDRFGKFLGTIQLERKSFDGDAITGIKVLKSLLNIVTSLGLIEYMNSPTSTRTDLSLFTRIHDHKENLELNLNSFSSSLTSCYDSYNRIEDKREPFFDYFLRKFNEDIPVIHDDCVNVSTIHSAKGLEFPVVFIMGSDFVGNWHTVAHGIPNAQKARLFYVACTRAKDLLYYGNRGRYTNIDMLAEKYFTSELPEFNSGNLLSGITKDLGREMPLTIKISKGSKMYRQWFPEDRVHVLPMKANCKVYNPLRLLTFQKNLCTLRRIVR